MVDALAICEFFDQRFDQLEMPCFGNMNIDYVTSRISIYTQAGGSWIVLFNSVVWWPASPDSLLGMIEVIGPGVVGRQGFDNGRITVPGRIESTEDDELLLAVSVRGRPIPLETLDVAPRRDVQSEIGFWACVALLEGHREMLLASDGELAPYIPAGFAKVAQLEEWEHPSFDVPPSRTETFRRLASAISSGSFGDVAVCARPNTHWSCWLPK